MAERQPKDFYPTDPRLALKICESLALYLPQPSEIVEPSAGTGAFVRACKQVWPGVRVTAVEIQEEFRQACLDAGADGFAHADWEAFCLDGFNPRTLAIGNPPFSLALPHIRAALRNLNQGDHLAFLLRMSWFGAKERAQFWKDSPLRYLLPIVPRPSFGKNRHGKKGTDSTEYGVFVWEVGYTGRPEILPHCIWTE